MQDESKKNLGLERIKKWLYAKDLDERSSDCVLCGSCYGHGPANPMEDIPGSKEKYPPYEFYRFQRHTPKSRWSMAQRVFHGLDPITPALKEIIYSCTTCLMCQELYGVRADGYGRWDITVAMREQITDEEGPIDAHRHLYLGLQQHDNPWSQPSAGRGSWADGLGLQKIAARALPTLLFAGCSSDQASSCSGVVALAKLLQKAGEDLAILGDQEKCCGRHAYDLGFRREYERLQQENLATIAKAGVRRLVIACGSCQRIWREHTEVDGTGLEVLHGVEYVQAALQAGQLKITKGIRKKVTYHDSCHLGRGCGIYEAPRAVLRAIRGVEIAEMKRNQRWVWRCGGGGGVPKADPNLARWSATDRMREARETGAELILTSSALCQSSLNALEEPALPTQDLIEFVAQAV